MALDFLSGLAGFLVRHKLIVGFYLLILLLIYRYRRKFEFQGKIVAICRTQIGLKLMDRIASRHRELVKLFGYVGIGAGFLSMALIFVSLGLGVYTVLTVPGAPAQIAPILPGVHIPGTPEEFAIPFIEGIIAIFIVAAIHEFAHGVVAMAHDVKVKSSGPAIVGPIFAAFVEPDEAQLRRKDDVVQYSLFAAGTFSNLLLGGLVAILLALVVAPIGSAFFPVEGVQLRNVVPVGPSYDAGLRPGMVVTAIDGVPVRSNNDIIVFLSYTRLNETVQFTASDGNFSVVAGENANFSGRGYFGIELDRAPARKGDDTRPFAVFSWVHGLFDLIAKLSFGIGLANMIPLGPIDGGKMMHLALQRIRGEKKASRTFVKLSLLLLLVILFLLSPIFRAVLKSVLSLF